jgi:kynurenine formamidase
MADSSRPKGNSRRSLLQKFGKVGRAADQAFADLEAAMRRQNMAPDAVKPGDYVFLHTGWGPLWNKDNATFVKGEPGLGIPAAKWFIEKQVVLIGADTWGVEIVPNPDSSLGAIRHQHVNF